MFISSLASSSALQRRHQVQMLKTPFSYHNSDVHECRKLFLHELYDRLIKHLQLHLILVPASEKRARKDVFTLMLIWIGVNTWH